MVTAGGRTSASSVIVGPADVYLHSAYGLVLAGVAMVAEEANP